MTRQEDFNPNGPFLFRSPTKSAGSCCQSSGDIGARSSALACFPAHGPALANEIFLGATLSMLKAQASPDSLRNDNEINDSVMVHISHEPNVRACPNETTSWTCCGMKNDHDELECRKCGNRRCHVKAERWGNCFASISLDCWKCTVSYSSNTNSLEVCASCETPHV